MEHEKEPSSSGRDAPEPRGLLYILLSVFSFFFLGWSLSKRHAPKAADSCQTEDSANNERERRQYVSRSPVRVVRESVPPAEFTPEESKRKKKADFLKWSALVVNTLTLFAVAWYAILTRSQLKVSENNFEAVQEHFRTDERAWVGIEVSRPSVKAPANNKFPALFGYEGNARNTGKTVARCVEIRSERQGGLGSLAMTENKEIIDNWQDKFLLGKFQNSPPESEIIRSAPKVLAPGQVTPIPVNFAGQGPRNNFGAMFVGRVDYIDEFSVRHWVKFCFFIADGAGNLWYCKYGNDEDRNPETPPKTEPTCPVTEP